MSKTWRYKRLFDILPGAIVWVVLLMPITLAIFAPRTLAIVMIFFLSYWLVRTFFMSYHLIEGYFNYKRETNIDWLKELKELAPQDDWKNIYHLVMVPEYKEPIEILRASVESVINSDYPTDKVIYLLCTEARDENGLKVAKTLQKEYNKKIDFHFIEHPAGLPQDKVIGKGPNITYAGKKILKYIEEKKIPLKNVIVTNMDADHVMDKKYLACLTYKYITDPDPVHKSYQPLPMFFNNIWDVPMLTRLIAMGSSFWQLIVTTRPSRLRNFSAQAQSLDALVKTDFWSTETIVEDGHQFWRSYYRFNGRHEVVPLYTPIYQDAVLGETFNDTLKEQYLQKRRWSWGVSDISYVMEHTIGNKNIPFIDRWSNALILWESHISWSTTSLILATSSWLPLALNPEFQSTVLAFNFPIIYSYLVSIAWIGMITTLIISTLLVPPHRGKKPAKRILLDWILTPIVLPISNIIFSSIPALVSQTKLMFGKNMGVFRVTKKSTKRSFLD